MEPSADVIVSAKEHAGVVCLCVLFRIVPVWSLKNKEVFRNGLMDCPRGALKTRWYSGLDMCIVSMWSLKNEKVLQIGLVDLPRVEP